MDLSDGTRPVRNVRKNKMLIAAGVTLLLTGLFLSMDRMPGHRRLEALLLAQLALPASVESRRVGPATEHTVIYVLGGTQASLERKFEMTVQMYHRGPARIPVLFLQQPGITAFDPLIGRNLTNREWAVRSLESRGVRKELIGTVPRAGGAFFGTLSEARMLLDVSAKAGYTSVILVTSRFHARRTWRTFSAVFGKDRKVTLALWQTNEEVGLQQLLIEFAKNVVYDVIVLPLSGAAPGRRILP